MSVEVHGDSCFSGNVDGAPLEAVTAIAKLTVLVCLPVGVEINDDARIALSVHHVMVVCKIDSGFPALGKRCIAVETNLFSVFLETVDADHNGRLCGKGSHTKRTCQHTNCH